MRKSECWNPLASHSDGQISSSAPQGYRHVGSEPYWQTAFCSSLFTWNCLIAGICVFCLHDLQDAYVFLSREIFIKTCIFCDIWHNGLTTWLIWIFVVAGAWGAVDPNTDDVSICFQSLKVLGSSERTQVSLKNGVLYWFCNLSFLLIVPARPACLWGFLCW
jgi:hypothetical protein